jgi:hypothetical protein
MNRWIRASGERAIMRLQLVGRYLGLQRLTAIGSFHDVRRNIWKASGLLEGLPRLENEDQPL